MAVVGAFELVLDDDNAPIGGLGLDVQPELTHRYLGRGQRERKTHLLRQDVQVVRQPGREVPRLGQPDLAGLGDVRETAQSSAVDLRRPWVGGGHRAKGHVVLLIGAVCRSDRRAPTGRRGEVFAQRPRSGTGQRPEAEPCEVHERAPACTLIHTVMAREWHAGRVRPIWIFRRRASYRANLQVRSGGRGIRTLEELAPLAVFKTAAIGL